MRVAVILGRRSGPALERKVGCPDPGRALDVVLDRRAPRTHLEMGEELAIAFLPEDRRRNDGPGAEAEKPGVVDHALEHCPVCRGVADDPPVRPPSPDLELRLHKGDDRWFVPPRASVEAIGRRTSRSAMNDTSTTARSTRSPIDSGVNARALTRS